MLNQQDDKLLHTDEVIDPLNGGAEQPAQMEEQLPQAEEQPPLVEEQPYLEYDNGADNNLVEQPIQNEEEIIDDKYF